MSISASRSIFPAMRVISAKSMPIPKNCRPSFGPPSFRDHVGQDQLVATG
jgi:hypothetical protein